MANSKKILLGVCGGIAAYKICSVVRLLKKSGMDVRVVMTDAATKFVSPLTFSTLSQNETLVSLWPENSDSTTSAGVRHIDLGMWADLIVIAPATANTIAKIAHGFADNALTSIALSRRCPMVIAPSMDVDMYRNAATQENITLLRKRGCFILPPAEGELASGLTGPGRLPEPEEILLFIQSVLNSSTGDLKGKIFLITAGPTFEPIDPVRYIGNRSSGKMGFALAHAASLRGASVTLIAGPVSLSSPEGLRRIDVETAEEMHRAVMRYAKSADCIIMAAAVADFAPEKFEQQKIKKRSLTTKALTLQLKENPDILKDLGKKKGKAMIVGFALETENEIANAKEKLRSKNADMIVLNSARKEGAGIGSDTNIITVITADGMDSFPKMLKFDAANALLNRIQFRLQKRKRQ